MYFIGILELFNTKFHGLNENSTKNVEYHFLVYTMWCKQQINDVYEDIEYGTIDHISRLVRYNTVIRNDKLNGFEHLPGCKKYLLSNRYLSLNIFTVKRLENGEVIGIPTGTFWLRIFQRRIRKYLTITRKRVKYFRSLKNLLNREIGNYYN